MVLRESVVQWGKPSKATLRCAERRLNHLHATGAGEVSSESTAAAVGGDAQPKTLSHIWMVGDNPASDMAFSALGGSKWRGCLVKTGVYVDTDAQCGAAMVCDHVADAVAHILATAKEENDN
jgi:ribonucleotide monophosphatase NagD (HAD superfamily)